MLRRSRADPFCRYRRRRCKSAPARSLRDAERNELAVTVFETDFGAEIIGVAHIDSFQSAGCILKLTHKIVKKLRIFLERAQVLIGGQTFNNPPHQRWPEISWPS